MLYLNRERRAPQTQRELNQTTAMDVSVFWAWDVESRARTRACSMPASKTSVLASVSDCRSAASALEASDACRQNC